jgi:hypothetical protein
VEGYNELVKSFLHDGLCQSGFATLSTMLLLEQPAVVLLLERVLVSWSLTMNERGGHEDLRGLARRSITPYVHGRMELYCSSMSCLCEPEPFLFSTFGKWRLPDSFIAQDRVVTLRPGTQQVTPRWLKPYTTSRVLMTRSS